MAPASSLFEDAKYRKYNFHDLDTRRDFENLFIRLATCIPAHRDKIETLDEDMVYGIPCALCALMIDFTSRQIPYTRNKLVKEGMPFYTSTCSTYESKNVETICYIITIILLAQEKKIDLFQIYCAL